LESGFIDACEEILETMNQFDREADPLLQKQIKEYKLQLEFEKAISGESDGVDVLGSIRTEVFSYDETLDEDVTESETEEEVDDESLEGFATQNKQQGDVIDTGEEDTTEVEFEEEDES